MPNPRVLLTVPARAARVLGWDTENLSATHAAAALERFGSLVARATREVSARLTRAEWNYLADVLNGCADLWDFAGRFSAGTLIRAEAADAHRINRAGDKWFGKKGDAAVLELDRKLAEMNDLQAEAVLAAVRHFWLHHEDVDINKDEWWTIAHRDQIDEEGEE